MSAMTSGTPAQVGRVLSAPAVGAILDYLRDEIGFASFARDLAGHIEAQAHRVEQLEAALRDAREYLLNCPYRPSDTTGREWNRVMDVSGAALKERT